MDAEVLPSVSVIVPVYNDDEWLSEALTSVLEQTLSAERMEVIVVDDGSTDDSYRVAEEVLEETDIQSKVLSIPNGGPSRARNVGCRQAKGKWVQFLDADDVLAQHKLRHQLEKASSGPEDTAVLYSDWQELNRVDGEWQVGTPRTPFVDEDPSRQLLASQNFVPFACALVRRSWLDRVGGFDERYSLVEDVHLQLRLALAGGKFVYVPTENPVFFYRKLENGSLSEEAGRTRFRKACVRNANLVKECWQERDAMTPERKRTLLDVYFQAARTFAGTDPDQFQSVWRLIQDLNPYALPKRPLSFRILSRVFGFPAVARVAAVYHDCKQSLLEA